VRPPITTFASLGSEGAERVGRLKDVMARLDRLMDEIEGAQPVRKAA
jgi:4-hydroxy-tetrahydrodipicolinate synthase